MNVLDAKAFWLLGLVLRLQSFTSLNRRVSHERLQSHSLRRKVADADHARGSTWHYNGDC